MRGLRQDADVQAAIRAAATDETSRGFAPVLKTMADYDTDKPAEKQEIVGPIEVRVRFVKEGKRP